MLYKDVDVGAKSLLTDIRKPKAFRVGSWNVFYWFEIALIILLDSLAISLAWVLATKFGTSVANFFLLANNREQFSWLWLIIAVNLTILCASGLYQSGRLADLFKSLSLAHVSLIAIAYLINPGVWVSRSVLIYAWLLILFLVASERVIVSRVFVFVKRRFAFLKRKVLLLGNKKDTANIQKSIESTGLFKIIDIVDLSLYRQSESLAEVVERAYRQKVDELFICSWENIEDPIVLFWGLKCAGINWRICPIDLKIPAQWSEIKMIDKVPTIKFSSSAIVGVDFLCKRIFDIAVSFLLLAALSFPLLTIAILIKIDSPGSIFYKQARVGLKGRHFKVWKFRTMVSNASQLQKELETQNEVKGGVLFKIKNDPRITRVGKILRRYSLDELPQLINVLRGEMSLVGPRPLPIRDIEKLDPHYFLRHEVLPGITGLWQVSGRSNTDSNEVFYLDFTYIQNWSLTLDCKILLKTIRVIFTSEGAY
jgi:exopolysaccharide biosynthesis polyprenyl glycosylphosphotransferase